MGQVTTFGYDPVGNRTIALQDASNSSTLTSVFGFDSRNRMTSSQQPNGLWTTYA